MATTNEREEEGREDSEATSVEHVKDKEENVRGEEEEEQEGKGEEEEDEEEESVEKKLEVVEDTSSISLYPLLKEEEKEEEEEEDPSGSESGVCSVDIKAQLVAIAEIQRKVNSFREQVVVFSGPKGSKSYVCLEETLISFLLSLDCMQTFGRPLLRRARKTVVVAVQELLQLLESCAESYVESG